MSKSWFTKGYIGYADTVGAPVHLGRDGRAHSVGQGPPPVPGAQPAAEPPQAPAAPPRPDAIIGLVDILNRGPYSHEASMALVRQHLGGPGPQGWVVRMHDIFAPLVAESEGAGNAAGAQRLRNMATDLGNVLDAAQTTPSALPVLYSELNMAALGVDFFAQNPKGSPQQLQQIMAQQRQAQQPEKPQQAPPAPPAPAPAPPVPSIPAVPVTPLPGAAPSAQAAFPEQQPSIDLELSAEDRALLEGLSAQMQQPQQPPQQQLGFEQLQQQLQSQRQRQRPAKRSKKIIIALIVIAVLGAGGAAAYFALKK